jgi:hypothetical protein
LLLLVCACACKASVDAPIAAPAPAPVAVPVAAPPPLVPGQPLVELRSPGKAVVNGQEIAFDGIEEGLVWPSLDKAVPDETYPGAVVVRIDRGEPMKDVLRVVFTLREADLRLEGQDAGGAARFVTVGKKPSDGAPSAGRCRLAVFRRDDGSLRVAAPGGPRELAAPGATDRLVDALEATEEKCPIRYVAFGVMDSAGAFGPLFDVMLAVDAAKAAGAARYVLAEPIAPPNK